MESKEKNPHAVKLGRLGGKAKAEKHGTEQIAALGKSSRKPDAEVSQHALYMRQYRAHSARFEAAVRKHWPDITGAIYHRRFREYSIWHAMKNRCLLPSHISFEHYGGRGITVCERWLDPDEGFTHFIEDMGFRPTAKHSLDRINNDGNYEPSNCRWATSHEQNLNRRPRSRRTTGTIER